MSFSGALGRGTYQSIIAGTATARRTQPTYYPLARELLALRRADADVRRWFFVRDKIFDNRFKAGSALNGSFKFTHNIRNRFHLQELMPAIRRRTILIQRIREQRRINDNLIKSGGSDPRDAFATADAAAYFAPHAHTTTNTLPNYWQHATMAHVVPQAQWRRHPELGGITRVHNASPRHMLSF